MIELYWGSGVCDDVPALAWYLVSALIPLTLGITALATVLLGDYSRAQAVAQRVAKVLPSDVSDQVVQLILRTRRDSPLLITISIVLMVWTMSGAVGVVERCLSRLLDRPRFGMVLLKARQLGLAAGLVLVVVLMVLAAAKATHLQSRLGLDGAGSHTLFVVGSLLAIGAVCASLYHFSPRDGIPWRDAAVGAIPAAIALELTPTLAAYYLRWVAGTTPVQVFLVLAGVLFTCYIASMAMLIGGAIAVRRVDARPDEPAGDESTDTVAVQIDPAPGIANQDRGP